MDIDELLQHYASPYYDPVKAHEYYMRTREPVSYTHLFLSFYGMEGRS